jgi:hypothetical protein
MRTWFRVHRSDQPALDFAVRPFHRFSHAECPYPLLYVGPTIHTCVWEVFGDALFEGHRVIALSQWTNRCVSQITVPELKVCAVSLEKTREAMGVDKGSLLAANLDIPQEWGLAVQRHPAAFQAIKYTSRFVDQPCLGLFDRDDLRLRLKVATLGPLQDLEAAVDWLQERKVALV